jgi:hypothetical protein
MKHLGMGAGTNEQDVYIVFLLSVANKRWELLVCPTGN